MRSLSRKRLAALALGGLFLLPALPVMAAETSGAGVALVPRGEVVDDDLYAAAVTVIIAGTVDGDLIAAAAERVVIEGEVTGSVTALAPEVVIRGHVGGSVRTASGTLLVSGEVEKDIVTSSWRVELGAAARVGGEVLFWARRVASSGTVEGAFRGSASRIELAGGVGRVDISVGHLVISGPLTVSGDLAYRSRAAAEGLDRAEVDGTVVQRAELPPNIRVRALGVLARLLAVVFVAIAAVTIVWCWPDSTRRAAARVRSPRAWLLGLVVLLTPALLVGLGWLVLRFAPPAASLPLLAVLVPVFLAVVGVLALAALVSAVPVAAALGTAMFRALGLYGATLGGSMILGAAWLLPWVGWLVPALAIPAGLGAWLTSRSQPLAATA